MLNNVIGYGQESYVIVYGVRDVYHQLWCTCRLPYARLLDDVDMIWSVVSGESGKEAIKGTHSCITIKGTCPIVHPRALGAEGS